MARELLVANRVQWNNGFEATRPDCRLKPWPCLGNALRTASLQSVQRGRDAELPTEGGVHRKHRIAVPCAHMLAEVIRRLQDSRTELAKTIFKEALNIVKSEVKIGRTFPTQELDAVETWSRMENTPENDTRGDGTCDTAECNSSQHWRRRVRKPGNTTADGTSPSALWSRCDTLRNVSSTHADHDVETLDHRRASTTSSQQLLPNIVIESTRVTDVDREEEPDENDALESRLTENEESGEYARLG